MFADLDVRVTEQLEILLICLSEGSVTLVPQCTFRASRLATRTAPSVTPKDHGVFGLAKWENHLRQLHRI